MSLYVYPSWDFAQIGAMTFNVTDGTAAYDVVISSSVHSHVTYASVVSTVTAFPAVLKAAIEAARPGGDTHTFTVTYTEATRAYTITPDSSTIKLTFTVAGAVTAAGAIVAKNVLGFSGNTSAAASVTSDIGVYYAIAGAEGAQVDVYEREVEDVGDVAEGDDGSSAMVARSTAAIYYDCTIPYETEAATYTRAVAAAMPWTWQHFFAHIRTGNHHFALKDTGTGKTTVHRLRKDGMSFAPEMVSGDKAYQAYLHIPLRTYLIGRI